jgi:predicted DNA-binding transcriptional regulator YafY
MLSFYLAERLKIIFRGGAMPGKNESSSTYGEKLIKTFAELLFTGRRKSMTDLSKALNCSKSTVRRIVDDLSLVYSIKIMEETVGRQLYFWIDRPQHMTIPALSTDELAVLEMCSAFTRNLLGKMQFNKATMTLQKGHLLLSSGADRTNGYEFGCFRPGTIDYTPHQEVLRNLIEGITKKQVCEIAYQAMGADEARRYFIMPLKIFSHKDTVYVHARRCTPDGEPFVDDEFYPLLAVHRFKDVVVLKNNYELPADYDFDEYFNRTFGIIKDEKFRVKARFAGWAAKYVSERIWSPNQQITKLEGDLIILEFDSASEAEVLTWILSFGSEAILLEPDWLSERAVAEIRSTLAEYEKVIKN